MAKQNFQITGKVHQIGQPEIKSEKLTVRSLVLECEDGNYKQYPSFQASNDRCDLLDAWRAGQDVTVHFSIQGRAWQDKFFNTLAIWKIAGNFTAPTQDGNEYPDQLVNSFMDDNGTPAPPNETLPF